MKKNVDEYKPGKLLESDSRWMFVLSPEDVDELSFISSLNIGPLFPATISCAQSTQTSTATAASATLGTLGGLGALTDTVTVNRTASLVNVSSSSDIASLGLTGIVSADAIHSTVSTTSDGTTFSSTGGVTFTNLAIVGQSVINGSVLPNTVYTIPGIGTVTLNEQNPANLSTAGVANINAIDIKLSVALGGLPVGTHIVIGHVKSGFVATTTTNEVNAKAYGALASGTIGVTTVKIGPVGQVIVGCLGGNKTVTNAALALTIPSVGTVGSLGTITDTATGTMILS